MFTGSAVVETDEGPIVEVPDWSGVFIETLGEDYGMMMVSNFDERQHRPPAGWTAARHFTSPDGDFEVFSFVRSA